MSAIIGLTTIYQSLRAPNHQAASECRQSLRAADANEIDQILRRIVSASKKQNARWPMKRLLRCADYVLIHCRPSRHILRLRSLRLCVKLATAQLSARPSNDISNDDLEGTTLAAAKFVSSLLKCSSNQMEGVEEAESIHVLLLRQDTMPSLLHWALSARNMHVRIYALNAMSINVKYFANDLIQHGAFSTLSSIVLETAAAFDTPNSFEISVNASRLLGQLLKVSKSLVDPTNQIKALEYVDSVSFVWFLQCWSTVCRKYVQNTFQVSNLQKLVYPLTDVVSQCASISPAARQKIQRYAPIGLRHGVLIREMRGFLSTIHQEQSPSGGYGMKCHVHR